MKNRLFIRKTLSHVTKVILLLLTPYLIYSGCIKVSNEEIPVTLDVTNQSLDFPPAGAERNFTVSSNFEWKVTVPNDASWLNVYPQSGSDNGTVTVIAASNQNTSSRSTTITVSNGVPNKEQTIAVTQNSLSLTVSEASLSFSNNAESKSFNISSSTSWTVNKGSTTWLTVSPASGSNNGTINVTAEANTSTSERTATITVSGGGITRNINVTQAGVSGNLTVSTNSLSFSSAGEQKSFDITSNTSWNVSRGSASWLTVSPSSGSNNGTVTVTAASNTSTSERTATVTVSGDGITGTINVTQAGTQSAFGEPEMIFVQGGTFTMGCTSEQGGDCWDDETPTHQVTLSDFYIGKYEVTQGLWKAVMGNNPSAFPKGDNYPVETVSWNDIVGTSGATMVIKNITYYANGFIYKLNQLTGKQYRLPTEAEWEYAARGGRSSNRYKYSGSNTVGNVAWYGDNSNSSTHAVGGKSANELGIYDMSGNVWEWCSDWYGSYSSNAQTNPTGPSSGSRRVDRGGSWLDYAFCARVSYRYGSAPGESPSTLGFRLAHSSN